MTPACDDGVEVAQPVEVARGAGPPAQQVVHDDVRVVPQAVGCQKQLAPARAQALQQPRQPRVLLRRQPQHPMTQHWGGLDHEGKISSSSQESFCATLAACGVLDLVITGPPCQSSCIEVVII